MVIKIQKIQKSEEEIFFQHFLFVIEKQIIPQKFKKEKYSKEQ